MTTVTMLVDDVGVPLAEARPRRSAGHDDAADR
jgi:hypothetical protein